MRSYECHILESGEDIIIAQTVGLIEDRPTECVHCDQPLFTPFTIRLGEDEIPNAVCTECLPIPRA